MSAISKTIEELDDTFHFIDGLMILRRYATEAFTIGVIEVGSISVSGCKQFTDQDLRNLTELGWSAWVGSTDTNSGAEYHKLHYIDT